MNSPKEELIRKINDAFAIGDNDFIIANVTEDIRWTIVGDRSIFGKNDFIKAIESMGNDNILKYSVTNIITHGITAAADGTIKVSEQSGATTTYAFCDIYHFRGHKDGKVKEMTSYVIKVTE